VHVGQRHAVAVTPGRVAKSDEWVRFPGGELEGRRPKALCPACRSALNASALAGVDKPRPLCFQCYRAEIDRARALKAAGDINTASETRFQSLLPFEAIDRPRLEMLKADRAAVRLAMQDGAGRFELKRRRAQLAARRAVQQAAAASAIHAAEMQLPESWIPFVVSR